MSKRLQVLLDEQEWREIKRAAKAQQMTVAEWVRQALRSVRHAEPTRSTDRKLRAVREGARGNYPSGGINEILRQIERGYTDDAT